MPGKNGLECLQEIKQRNGFEKVPVYLYSTGLNETDCKKALAIGAKDCIKKPPSVNELSKILDTVLSE